MLATDEAIAELVDRIYDLPLNPDGWDEFTPGLESIVRGKIAVLTQSDRSVGFVQACSTAAAPDADEYLDRYWTSDRAMTRLRGAPAGATVVDSQLVSDAERKTVAFYRDYLDPRDLHRGCYVVLSRRDGQSLILGVHRPDRRDDFGVECLRILEAIRPHLARGLAIGRRLAEAATIKDAAADALGRTGWGMILTNSIGEVRSVSAAGEAFIGVAGLRIRGGRLDARTGEGPGAFESALARAARSSGGEATLLTARGDDGEVVHLSVSPARVQPGAEPLALVLAKRREAAPDEALLRRTYGLTPAEGRLLRALVAGESLANYAERSGVLRSTVKTHLGNIFSKTGARRQGELVSRALTDPALRLHLQDEMADHDWGGPQRRISAT